ncbi:bifunctional DNA primase/polymerase [bacterium]|nr:bifunctional DNA primase/polymerase [bacterium]
MQERIFHTEHALEIARLGLPVFPLWWPRDGGCACRAGRECRQPGKHPRILGWQQEATTDETKIRQWWAHWPMANIGVATGRITDSSHPGTMVLDVDAAAEGIESLAALEAAHGPLPETVEVLTGRSNLDGVRGRHIYFRHPGLPLGNSVKKLGPGLDLRCDGGLVVGPGSVHASGQVYEWEIAHHPEDMAFAEAPRWLLDLILIGTRQIPVTNTTAWTEPDGLPPVEVRIERAKAWLAGREPAVQGQGGSSHTMGLCSVVTRGFALERDEDALEALSDWNARCAPPWDDRPEAKAADSLLRKIREARTKSYICGIADKLQPPRRAYFGSQLTSAVEAEQPEPGEAEEVRILAITGSHGELPNLVKASERALRMQPIYSFGGSLVTVRSGAGGPSLLLTAKDHLRLMVNQVIGFAKPAGKEYRPCWPPDEVLGGLLNKGAWDLPEITSIVETPTLRPDGTILDAPGFDAQTGIMFVSGAEAWEPVPDEPTKDQVEEAFLWLNEPFVDFPFQAPHHRAAAVAALITAVIRPAIAGPVPMFLFDATTPGTGKGLLANVISIVATGRRVPIISPVSDDEEMRKLITSLAMEGARMVVFDNVARSIGGPALDAALTSTWWRGRILGTNRTFSGPLKPFWGATGNNIPVKGDMVRRVVSIRMASMVEDPETRQDFVHPDLLAWVRQNRSELVKAALTVVRAHVVARPERPAGLPRLGGFEEWDDLVRAPLVWHRLPDILEGKKEIRRQDGETMAFGAVLEAWHKLFRNEPRTLQVVKRTTDGNMDGDVGILRDALIELAPSKDGKDWDPVRVRSCFRRYQGRVFGGLCLSVGDRAKSGMRWWVDSIDP